MLKYFIFVILVSATVFSAEHGVFVVVKGKVFIENIKSNLEAKVNSKVQVGDTIVTAADSRAKIVMSDRNIINISPNTRLKIEKYSNDGGNKNVNLNLIEGKIRNNVEQKYDNKNSKFEVRTATAVAGVRGTQFVTSYSKSTRVTEVITIRGQVLFQSLSAAGEKLIAEPVIVNKGEKSLNNEQQAPSAPVKLTEIEVKQIDAETTVKAKNNGVDSLTDKNKVREKSDSNKSSPAPSSQLLDLNKDNNLIKDETAARKFERSKVKISVTPAN